MSRRNWLYVPDVRALSFASIVLLGACGGGGDGNDETSVNTSPGTTCKACFTPPKLPLTATTPSARWDLDPTHNLTYGKESLSIFANQTVAGLNQAEFFVDGQSVFARAYPNPQDFAESLSVEYQWNTDLVSDGYHYYSGRVSTKDGIVDVLPSIVVKVQNNYSLPVVMSAREIVPNTPLSQARGSGQININLATGVLTGSIELTDMTATSVDIHDGYATQAGPSVISLSFDAMTNRWIVPPGSAISATGAAPTDVYRFLRSLFYIDAHSATFPGGEIRAQLLMPTATMKMAELVDAQFMPPARAFVALTADMAMNEFRVDAYPTSVGSYRDLTVYKTPPFNIVASFHLLPRSQTLWSGTASYLAMRIDGYDENAQLYISSYPPSSPPTPMFSPLPAFALTRIPTLTELEATVFTPKCASCHNGVGSSLPGSLNLTAGNTFASLVGVASVQQPNLKRVDRFSTSYLIDKLFGISSIGGERMPLGGPYLTVAEIEAIGLWIDNGRPR
jgi:hypothetical protein